jgi:NAD(P)-dependent dehydrogenase (short-subunit alcohol dehydrogenase family)
MSSTVDSHIPTGRRGDGLSTESGHWCGLCGSIVDFALPLSTFHRCSVEGQADTHPIALQVMGNLGGLDALINNASALGPTPLALLADTESEELEQALSVNLLGPFRLTKALFGALAASARNGRGAVVINISSDAAVNPYSGWGAYAASKAALRHLTAIWAEEVKADGISFLSLDPGDMDTPLHALAVPDADPMTLRRPEDAAEEIVEKLLRTLPNPIARRAAEHQ